MGPRDEHVTVVGAGMVGLSSAWYLQQAGFRVTVVDREGVGVGSSWGNAGWLTPALTLPLSHPSVLRYAVTAVRDPASPLYVPLAVDPQLLRFLIGFTRNCTPARWRRALSVFAEVSALSLDAFDEMAGESDGLEPTTVADPFLAGFTSVRDRDALVDELTELQSAGGHVDYAVLSGDELRAFEPSLSEAVVAGLAIDGQRYLDPPRFLDSLARSVRARGGEIVDGFLVQGLRARRAGVDVVGSRGRLLQAGHVVIATGAWLPALARQFGVRQAVQSGRGYSFTVVPGVAPTHPVYFPAQRVACTPLGERLRVAGMMEFRRADAPLDPRRIDAIVEAASPLLEGVDWGKRSEEWVGSRPCTSDGLPLVGRTRSPRVHVAGGHGMWGIALGPLTGKLIAGSVAGTDLPALARHLDPLR